MYTGHMHMYQKHILDELRHADQRRYSELQPDGVESSHFKYHLDQLITDGLVARIDRGIYALSDKGRAAVDRLSDGRINPELTPKVITYTLFQDSDNYYLYRKDKEPYRGLLTMVTGKMHLDESAADASVREVKEKLGFAIEKSALRAVANVRIRRGEQLLTHVVAHVFVATTVPEDNSGLEKIPKAELAERTDLVPDQFALLSFLHDSDSLGHLELDIAI